MIAIIDYGMGNVKSVYNALEYLGENAVITCEKNKIEVASHIILPGVGAFGDAMDSLKKRELIDILKEQVLQKKKRFLGLCLGMQLLADYSLEYGKHAGLGWIKGYVRPLPQKNKIPKIPHVGWDEILIKKKHYLLTNLNSDQLTFYFVHSYYFDSQDNEDVWAICSYGIDFPAIIIKNNIIGMQFHPEKSQDNGLQLLRNFINRDI